MITIPRHRFVDLVRQAYHQVPTAMRDALNNVDIAVEEWPQPDELSLLDSEGTLFGLYTGVPLPERDGGQPLLPDRIVIYRQPILRNCDTLGQAAQEIRVTLLHEIGHALGMGEEDLRRLGYD